jgi:hypothetical protein
MTKYESPFSVGRRQTVFVGSDDPRNKNGGSLEKYRSRLGRDVIVKDIGQPLTLDEYVEPEPPNTYWISDMYKEATANYTLSGAWFASLTGSSTNIYNWGSSRRIRSSPTEKVNGIFSAYNKNRTVLNQKKFYIDDANTSIYTYSSNLASDNKYMCSGIIGVNPSFTNSKAYVAKYESDMSSTVWANSIAAPSPYQITGFGDDSPTVCSTIDSSDNIYVAGSRKILVEGSTTVYRNIVFALKYNSSGVLQWQKKVVPTNFIQGLGATDIKIDASGNLYLLGYNDYSTASKPFIIKFNSADGTVIWQKSYSVGSSSSYQSRSMVIDSSGNIYVDIVFIVGSSNTPGAHLLKIDSSGSVIWSRIIPKAQVDSIIISNGTCLAIDSENNIYWTISLSTSYILKIDSLNTLLWSNKISLNCYIQNIAINSDNDIYLSGSLATSTSTDFPITIKLPSDGSLSGATYTVPDISGISSSSYSLTYDPVTFTYPSQTYTPTTTTYTVSAGDMISTSLSILVTDLTYLERGVFIP